MRKNIAIISLAALSLAACSQQAQEEITTCSFDIGANTKTCTLTADERNQIAGGIKQTIKQVDGVTYRELPNGTLQPIPVEQVPVTD